MLKSLQDNKQNINKHKSICEDENDPSRTRAHDPKFCTIQRLFYRETVCRIVTDIFRKDVSLVRDSSAHHIEAIDIPYSISKSLENYKMVYWHPYQKCSYIPLFIGNK